MKYNYHTHSKFCDGKNSLQEMVQCAIDQKMKAIGFSSHAPVKFKNAWSIPKLDDFDRYIRKIDILQERNTTKIDIYKAIEADYIPDRSYAFTFFRERGKLDYILGGVHLVSRSDTDLLWFIDGPKEGYEEGLEEVFNMDVKKGVSAYFHQINAMLENEDLDVLVHMDKIRMNNQDRFFKTTKKWYRSLVLETLKLLSSMDVLMEINTRGFYKGRVNDLFPEDWIIEEALKRNIPMVLSSDAHNVSELLCGFDFALEKLIELRCKEVYIYQNGAWVHQALDAL